MQQEGSIPQAAVTPIKVLFHSISEGMHCDDGFASAWVAYKFYKNANCLDSVEFIPAIYGKAPPMKKLVDANVFILDFSYPRQTIMEINRIAKNLTVLDHHKTAQKELEGIPGCIFDMNRSGAMMTWNYFFGSAPAPALIEIVQDNDLWLHKIPHCQELVRWIRSFKQDFKEWDEINAKLVVELDDCVAEAKAIDRYYQNQLEAQMGLAVPIKFGDLKGMIANCGKQYASDICHKLHINGHLDFACSWFMLPTGEAEISIRSDGRTDVSAIAKYFRGGGHAKASGWKMMMSELIRALNSGNFI